MHLRYPNSEDHQHVGALLNSGSLYDVLCPIRVYVDDYNLYYLLNVAVGSLLIITRASELRCTVLYI